MTKSDTGQSRKFQLRMDDEFYDRLIELCRHERDLPTRAEMLRRLVVRASDRLRGVRK